MDGNKMTSDTKRHPLDVLMEHLDWKLVRSNFSGNWQIEDCYDVIYESGKANKGQAKEILWNIFSQAFNEAKKHE